jgi:hypothetical protein
LKRLGFGSSLGFLPHAYSFGTYIIPFYYTRQNSLPVLSYDAAVGYNKIQHELKAKLPHNNHTTQPFHPYFSNPPIPSCFSLPDPPIQFHTISNVSSFNSPVKIGDWFHDKGRPVFNDSNASSFIQLGTHKNLFHTFFQLSCPIHIIIICLNDVIDDDRNDQSFWDEIQLDNYYDSPSHSVGTGQQAGLGGKNVFRSIKSLPTQPDPITKSQYKYFQQNVPMVYKHEIRYKIFHPFQSFYNFDKFEQDWVFHFVSVQDFHSYYEKIQNDAIQKQLDLYEDVLELR